MPQASLIAVEYFEWLSKLVSLDGISDNRTLLLKQLNTNQFVCDAGSIDSNLLPLGERLRDEFWESTDYDDIYRKTIEGPMSILEVMIALAKQVSKYLGSDTANDIPVWFWRMASNLGVYVVTDENYSISYINYCIERFNKREYDRDGNGSLFVTKTKRDMRKLSLWMQFQQYLNDFYFNTSLIEWRLIL